MQTNAVEEKQVKIVITIPESEYKNWAEYEEYGVPLVKHCMKTSFYNYCKSIGICDFKIDVDSE
jgi:hypothetical protein